VEDLIQFLKNMAFAEYASEKWPTMAKFLELKNQVGNKGVKIV